MKRILVVDDERDVRETLGLLLRHEGFHVVVAECGHTAIGAIEAFTFDAVLVDIVMPGMNGLDTISLLHQDAPDVALIAMSGYVDGSGISDEDFFRQAMGRGATCCLLKPFTREQLLDALEFCWLSKSLVA